MDFRRTSSPMISGKHSNLSITRQNSGGVVGPVRKDSKSNSRLKRISSISNPKHIRSSRIKRQEPNPPKFIFLVDTVESALKDGLQLGEEKRLLDGDNSELAVSLSILQHHLEQIQKLRNEYMVQLKIHDGASNLDQAYGGQPGTRAKKKSKAVLKTNMKKLNENLLDLEDQMFDFMGYIQITFKGLLDIPRLINNDCYEVCFDLSEQKWKTKGTVKNKEQRWQDEHLMMTILGDNMLMDVQAVQNRRFLGNVLLGSAKFNAYELISLHPQNVVLVLRGSTHVKVNLEVKWRFGYDDPDYGRIMDLSMHDVIIGSTKHDYQKKRAKQLSIQRARRVRATTSQSCEFNVDIDPSCDQENEGDMDQTLVPAGKELMHKSATSRSEDELTQSITSEVAELTTDTYNKIGAVRNVCSVLHRSPSQFKRGQVGYKPILIESDSARQELMNNLQLDTESNTDSGSLGSVCNLLEAFDNLWASIEDKKDFCDNSVLSELEVRLNKLSMLTRNKGAKHERRESLTASETDALDAFDFLNETTRIIDLQSTLVDYTDSEFASETKEDLKRSSDSGINLTGRRESLTESTTSGNTSTEGSIQYTNNTQILLLDDYSSDEEGLSSMLQEMVEMSKAELNKDQDSDIFENTPCTKDWETGTSGSGRVPSFSSKGDSLTADDSSVYEGVVLTTGSASLDFLLTTHFTYCEGLLQNIKPLGPLQFKAEKSSNLLREQIQVIDTIIDNIDKDEVNFTDLVPNLKSRELLLLWRACCGDKEFVAPLDNFSLALDTMFGDVWKNYPDVAHFVFPTIANQITTTTFDDGEQPAVQYLTIFQFYSHFKTKIISGLEEYVSEVAEDLSLYGGLTSEERYIVNVTLKRMAGMGFNTGILRAIPQMLLKPNESYQIADNYLKNITRDSRIMDEVGPYFISALEHNDQTIRQGACRALGRIKYGASIEALKYIRDVDVPAVRQEAKQALNRFCPE